MKRKQCLCAGALEALAGWEVKRQAEVRRNRRIRLIHAWMSTGARCLFMDETERVIDVTGAPDHTERINGDELIGSSLRYRF